MTARCLWSGYRTSAGGWRISACVHCGRDMCRIKDAAYIDIECREECVAKGPQLSPRLVTDKRPIGRPRKNRTVAAKADTTRIIGMRLQGLGLREIGAAEEVVHARHAGGDANDLWRRRMEGRAND
jgi:hypothetical protein